MRLAVGEWDAAVAERLAQLEHDALLRSIRPVEQAAAPVLVRDGRPLINLSSNNYLGLAAHPALAEAAAAAAERGAGATASRLIVGSDAAYADLERKVAEFKGTEAALVFGSGYLANLGALSALLERDDAVFSDRLNHASIWDGIRLSGAALYRYRHSDPDHLEEMLARAEKRGARRKLIVTDTVFSMDGDVAPLEDLVELKERYDAALVVDDAHGGGVFGAHGAGLAHELGVAERIDLHVGTFSKAFGVYGGFVAGRETWIRYLANSARSFIYTTGLPPVVVGAVGAALELVRSSDELRRTLRGGAEVFRARLVELGFDTCSSTTQIVPAVVGASELAVAFAHELERRGVLAVAIRPPTVPAGKARLRFSLTAAHAPGDLERALEAVSAAGRAVGVVDGG